MTEQLLNGANVFFRIVAEIEKFAPGATEILFLPDLSTDMRATPVE
jgi:hypothetical protein